MTDTVAIVNRALQSFGSRTTVTSGELASETSNEAKQANLALQPTRKQLLRMAPWDCGLIFNTLTYITSAPGTPENTTQLTTWARGVPAPPWQYEYQYPENCLKACWIVPQLETGVAGSVPIFPVTTGFTPSVWSGPAVRFKVATDLFIPVTAATVAAGGSGYVVGEVITLATTPAGSAPIGAPAQLRVLTLGGGGAVATVEVITQVTDQTFGGSYFAQQTNPVAQSDSSGVGTGATFNLTYGSQTSQRVILTNQPQAILAYIRDTQDINIMDPLFQEAWVNVLGSKIAYALSGDAKLANQRIEVANQIIAEARKADGNEGLTVDDRTPDWIRTRGFAWNDMMSPSGYDWGGMWPLY